MKIKNPTKLFKGLSIAETVLTFLSAIPLIIIYFNFLPDLLGKYMDVFLCGGAVGFFTADILCLALIALNGKYKFIQFRQPVNLFISHIINAGFLFPTMIDGGYGEVILPILTVFMISVRIMYFIKLSDIGNFEINVKPITKKKETARKIILWIIGISEIFIIFNFAFMLIGVTNNEKAFNDFLINAGINSDIIYFIFGNLILLLGIPLFSSLKAILNSKWKMLPQFSTFAVTSSFILWYCFFFGNAAISMFTVGAGALQKVLFVTPQVIATLLYTAAVIYQIICLVKMSRKSSM